MAKAKTTLIRATSRASVKIRDNYFTVEYSEERAIPEDANLEEERADLWECVNNECDNQILDIKDSFGAR